MLYLCKKRTQAKGPLAMYLTKTCYCATDFHRLRQVNAVKSVVVVYSTLFINLAINWKSTSTDKKTTHKLHCHLSSRSFIEVMTKQELLLGFLFWMKQKFRTNTLSQIKHAFNNHFVLRASLNTWHSYSNRRSGFKLFLLTSLVTFPVNK